MRLGGPHGCGSDCTMEGARRHTREDSLNKQTFKTNIAEGRITTRNINNYIFFCFLKTETYPQQLKYS